MSMNFYITYNDDPRHDYDDGYTFVHANNLSVAVDIWKAVHHRDKGNPLSCGLVYSEKDLKKLGMSEDDLGVCHDTIIYQDRKE